MHSDTTESTTSRQSLQQNSPWLGGPRHDDTDPQLVSTQLGRSSPTMATVSNDPGPNDPAAIRATALALLDCVEDRLSSPQGSTAFTGLADCVEDHTYSPRGSTASTDLVTSTADDVGLLSTPAGNLVLEDQYGTYALRLAALNNQLQD
jgi:hypothetical protein